MIIGIINSIDGYFAMEDNGNLVKISESQAKDLQSQLEKLQNQSSEDTLKAKCEKFVEALQEALPLIKGIGYLLYAITTINYNNSVRKYTSELEQLNVKKQIDDLKKAKSYPDKEISQLEKAKIDVGLKVVQVTTDSLQTMLDGGNNQLNDIRLEALNSKYNNLNDKISKLKHSSSLKDQSIKILEQGIKLRSQADYFDQLKDYQMLAPGVENLLYVVQNPQKILKALQNILVTGGDIFYTIGVNTVNAFKDSWNWMTTPKVKHVNETIAANLTSEKFDYSFHDEDSYANDCDNCLPTEVKQMGDFGMGAAAPA